MGKQVNILEQKSLSYVELKSYANGLNGSRSYTLGGYILSNILLLVEEGRGMNVSDAKRLKELEKENASE